MPRLRNGPRPDAASDAIASIVLAWSELRACLERQSVALSDEVRSYPTPIASCDEQLTLLIERRSRVIADLKAVNDSKPLGPGKVASRWRANLDEVLSAPESRIEDAQELALRARLKKLLRGLRH